MFKTKIINEWLMPAPIESFAFRKTCGGVIALKSGLAILNLDNIVIDFIVNPEPKLLNNRFDDGKCDRWGGFELEQWMKKVQDLLVDYLMVDLQ